jgi:deoxyribodipyrimidine photo-lyase
LADYRNSRDRLHPNAKFSPFLSQGCITASQVNEKLIEIEDGTNTEYKAIDGFKRGEKVGTTTLRKELLWGFYMWLCALKSPDRLYSLSSFGENEDYKCISPDDGNEEVAEKAAKRLKQFQEGTTGMGLIDASVRELIITGFTSNRVR